MSKRKKKSKLHHQLSDIKALVENQVPFVNRMQHLFSQNSLADSEIEKQLNKIERIRADLIYARKMKQIDSRNSHELVQ